MTFNHSGYHGDLWAVSNKVSSRTWCVVCSLVPISVLEHTCLSKQDLELTTMYAYRVECIGKDNLTAVYLTFRNKVLGSSVPSFCKACGLAYLDIYPKQHPMFLDSNLIPSKYVFKQCLKYYKRDGNIIMKKPVISIRDDTVVKSEESSQVSSAPETEDRNNSDAEPSQRDPSDHVGDNRMSFDMSLSPKC